MSAGPRDPSRFCNFPTRGTGMGCTSYRVQGMDRCVTHLGNEDRNEARIQKVVRVMGDAKNLAAKKWGTPHDIGPGEALLLLVQHKSAEVEYWRDKVLALDEIVGWREVERTEKDGQGQFGPTSEEGTKSVNDVHPWYKLLRDAERDLSTYAQTALRAGVEERLVRASEHVGVQMLGMLNDFVRQMGLSPADQARAATLIPALLRALPAPSSVV